MTTLYDMLGARPDDDAQRLKSAFRKAAKANHPDHHGGDPEAVARFTRIVKAYDILRDEGRRAAYDRLLESQRGPVHAKAVRATSRPARQFAVYAMAGAVAGIVLAGGGYVIYLNGMTGDDASGTIPPPRMTAVEPAKRADTETGEAPIQGRASTPPIPVTQGVAELAAEGKDAWDAAQGPSVPDATGQTIGRAAPSMDPTAPKMASADPGRDRGAEPPERPQSTEQQTAAISQDEICRRETAQLASLRISQSPDEVIRFERELGCERLRPQVARLRESVDPNR